jgi:hypothetical protein
MPVSAKANIPYSLTQIHLNSLRLSAVPIGSGIPTCHDSSCQQPLEQKLHLWIYESKAKREAPQKPSGHNWY